MATIVRDLISYLQCGTTIAANDAIYIDSGTGKIHPFDATNDALVFAGIAKEAGVLDDYIRVVQSGRVKGFLGLTPGQFVYASVTTPGGFQLVEPIASQKVVLGIAVSATELNINGGLGIKPGGDGGAGGGLDTYYTQDMEGLADTSDFLTGNNATFLGGGTFQGSLVLETSAPISGTKSLKYTQAAGSLNDYFASEIIDIDLKERNNTSGMTLYFTYNGNDNDMRFVVWDVTNNQRLSSEVAFVKLTGKATRYSLSFYVPTSCTQIRWGAQVLVVNSGKILVVDDVELSTDPFVITETSEDTDWSDAGYSTSDFTGFGTVTNIQIQTRREGPDLLIRGKFTSGTSTATEARLNLRFNNGLVVSASSPSISSIQKAGTAIRSAVAATEVPYTLIEPSVGYLTFGVTLSTQSGLTKLNGNGFINSGQSLTIDARVPIQGWSVSNPSTLTPTDTFSTDTAPLTYAGSSQYTLATLANAPIGTFITFTYAANTNTRTQTNAAPPTQTTADMNVNGIQIFTRAFNAASTATSPAVVAIQIGKGLKGITPLLYKGTGKVNAGVTDFYVQSSTAQVGLHIKDYNESTGVLVIDSGFADLATNNQSQFLFSDATTQNNGYIVINASKSAALTAVPTPLIAYLKDVKTSGTQGGTFTSGAWQTRTLNTVEGDTSFVTLSANQFTLPAGRYEIEAGAPGYQVGNHKVKLRNITDSSDAIIGDNTKSGTATDTSSYSRAIGTLNLTASKTFELQHQCQVTSATAGFGNNTGFGVSEIYATVKIKKVG